MSGDTLIGPERQLLPYEGGIFHKKSYANPTTCGQKLIAKGPSTFCWDWSFFFSIYRFQIPLKQTAKALLTNQCASKQCPSMRHINYSTYLSMQFSSLSPLKTSTSCRNSWYRNGVCGSYHCTRKPHAEALHTKTLYTHFVFIPVQWHS